MSSEMLESVARVIYEDRNGPGCKPWSRLPEAHQEPYRSDARAALTGIRNSIRERWGEKHPGAVAITAALESK